ncbi:MAG: DinB family protein [Vicinamibacteraceae bacterium]
MRRGRRDGNRAIRRSGHARRGRVGARVISMAGLAISVVLLSQVAAAQAPELGRGWLAEFNLAARQLGELAEATPADKFGWRPAPGVRSISEVYVHLAAGNLWLLQQAGVEGTADGLSQLPKDPEKSITDKAQVLKWLEVSFDAVRKGYQSADRQKKVEFLGRETTSDDVFLRILVHNHEHMGQAIAYARMNAIVPPWSKASGE